jgi:hypothetical protein
MLRDKEVVSLYVFVPLLESVAKVICS